MSARSSLMDFQVPKISHEDVRDNRGVFVIEPLDRGFGYTFGNSLRRVLLSSLEGAAVTSVKIEGVAHEFTTLPGVREDVTDIILNLKQLVCILHGESPEVEVRLTKRGEGVVTVASSSSAQQVIRDATDLVSTVAPWLQADHDGLTGKVLKQPERDEIDTPVQEQLIVELYSK